MTLHEENKIREACGLPVKKQGISEEQFFLRIMRGDEAGDWYEDYKRRNPQLFE